MPADGDTRDAEEESEAEGVVAGVRADMDEEDAAVTPAAPNERDERLMVCMPRMAESTLTA